LVEYAPKLRDTLALGRFRINVAPFALDTQVGHKKFVPTRLGYTQPDQEKPVLR
jgi:hypothetical protein